MNFADGPKEMKIGDTFFTTSPYRNKELGESRVLTAIGNKYIKGVISDGRSTYGEQEYQIADGKQKTDYSAGYAYSSQEAYERYKKERLYVRELEIVLSRSRMSYEQAVKIAEILNIKIGM